MKRIICVILPLLLLLQLNSCGETVETDTVTETVTEAVTEMDDKNEIKIGLLSPREGDVVSLLTEEMTGWLAEPTVEALTALNDHTEKCEPVPVTFCWSCEGSEYSHLLVSEKQDMSDPRIFLCLGDTLQVEDLYPGTQYYWQVVCSCGGKSVRSDVGSFSTLQTPRTVCIEGVSNVRDLGGKTTVDGRRVKYGMIYRGADFTQITDEGIRKAVDILGIKTELDLRERNPGGVSPLGENIRYISVRAPYYTNMSTAEYREDLLNEIRALTDPDNYPIYFHCSLGRDRTGTLAFIVLSLLDVSEEDIYLDYELSYFSDMGGYTDTTPPKTMISQLDALKSLLAPGKNSTATMYKRVSKTLKKLGVTDEEIEAIRSILLEG
ncbi:MAG: tyrosine-protein phosphatase [Clostridia bacterium]|nr:tyrosine-protein phosphatase [Clostridia bacterium]